MKKLLVLENGMVFEGVSFGANKREINELVFNTSMVGYQEILSDLSYCSQTVCMTYPLIGNYGITDEDFESITPNMGGFIVKDYNDLPSNFRYTKTLDQLLKEYNIQGITGIDTRHLTKVIRDEGSMNCIIIEDNENVEEVVKELKEFKIPLNQVQFVSSKTPTFKRTKNPEYNVVAIDCGMKLNIVRELNKLKCNVVIVPHTATYDEIMAYKPDGVFLSNGPGDPSVLTNTIETIKQLQGNVPMFGICLGHQLISLANNAKTYKMKYTHRGANHPVLNKINDKVEITSQNHSYAVEDASIKNTKLEVTHINLLDETIEGVRIKEDYVFSVQYHPESAPGPVDSEYLFKEFIQNMKEWSER